MTFIYHFYHSKIQNWRSHLHVVKYIAIKLIFFLKWMCWLRTVSFSIYYKYYYICYYYHNNAYSVIFLNFIIYDWIDIIKSRSYIKCCGFWPALGCLSCCVLLQTLGCLYHIHWYLLSVDVSSIIILLSLHQNKHH